jgi:flagellar biosynthesis protein FlhA
MTRQLIRHVQPMMITAVIIGAFALVPGFPKIPFLSIAAVCGGLAYALRSEGKKDSPVSADTAEEGTDQDTIRPEEMLQADMLSILVGVRLIPLVDPKRKSGVFERIGALRKKIAQKYGFIMPLIRLRDNLNLDAMAYEVRLYDHVIASGRIEPDKFLAMDSGAVQKTIKGIPTKEPVYGLSAIWINESDKETAELNGYTVIDPESVLITHLSETVARHAHELLTREDVQQLLERLRKNQPSLVGEVVPEVVSVGLLQRVLQNLLKENVPIRDLPLILESLGEHGGKTKSAVLLTEFVRKAICRSVTEQFSSVKGIEAITLDGAIEHLLINRVVQTPDSISLSIGPDTANQLTQAITGAWKRAMEKGLEGVVVLCDARIRSGLYNLLSRQVRRLPVLAYDEVVPGTVLDAIETVSIAVGEIEVGTALATV